MPKSYTLLPKGRTAVLVPRRDHEHLEEKGWAAMPDMLPIPSEYVVIEVDEANLTSRVVGIARDERFVPTVANNVTKRSMRAVRVDDLVDQNEIARRTGRAKATISRRWKTEHDDFPKPVKRFGNKGIYYWPDIKAFLRRHNLPLTQGKWAVEHNRKNGVDMR